MLCEYENTQTPIKEICKKYKIADRELYKAINNGEIEKRKSKEYASLIKNQELFYYLLGLISADGYLYDKKNRIEIGLHIKETDFLERISYAIYKENRTIVEERRNRVRLFIYGSDTYKLFCSYGLCQKKSECLNIDFDMIPKEYFHHFLRGFIDGDGNYLYRNINNVHMRLDGNKNMMFSIKKYIKLYFNLDSNVYKINPNVSFDFYRWVIQFTPNAKVLLNIIYSNCTYYMERKYNIIKDVIVPFNVETY